MSPEANISKNMTKYTSLSFHVYKNYTFTGQWPSVLSSNIMEKKHWVYDIPFIFLFLSIIWHCILALRPCLNNSILCHKWLSWWGWISVLWLYVKFSCYCFLMTIWPNSMQVTSINFCRGFTTWPGTLFVKTFLKY